MALDNITIIDNMISYSFTGNIIYGTDYYEEMINQEIGLTIDGTPFHYKEPNSPIFINGVLIIRRVTDTTLRNISGSTELSISTNNDEVDLGLGKGVSVNCFLTSPISYVREQNNSFTVTINYVFRKELT
jgi:hypothetical protein